MHFDPLDLSVAIADRLCSEAIEFGGRATWLGDEKENIAGSWEVVHRSVDGDLYGGTAGIGLYFTRLFAVTGTRRYRDAALAALGHATEWQRRARAVGSLYAGSGGIAAVLAEAGVLLGEEFLTRSAKTIADDAIDHPPVGADLIGGRAGSILALLYLFRKLGYERAREAAQAMGLQLIKEAIGEPYPGVCWKSDLDHDDAPLCGLAHGASGIGLALCELSLVADSPRFSHYAAAAALYERAWFQREEGNWPDLRELTRNKLLRGDSPKLPLFWCHGGIGIGLTRLRQFELSRDNVYAAEAETALLSAEKYLAELSDLEEPIDLCLCHGLAGIAELLLEASRVFDQPDLRAVAMSCGRLAARQASDVRGPWPCGVPDGGENPSLMLGLAGIGMMFLRLARPDVDQTGLLYTRPMTKTTVIVQLADPAAAAPLQQRAEALTKLVPGSRVERISKRGRVLLRLPATTAIDDAVAVLALSPDVRYAEPDVEDHAANPPSERGGEVEE